MKSERENVQLKEGCSSMGNGPGIAHSIHNGNKLYHIFATDAGNLSKILWIFS